MRSSTHLYVVVVFVGGICAGCGSEASDSPADAQKASPQARESSSSKEANGSGKTAETAASKKKGGPKKTVDPDVRAEVDRLLEAADSALGKQQLLPALKLLKQAIETDESDPRPHMQRARLTARMGQPIAALANFNRAVQLAPKNAAHRNARGFFLLKRNAVREAISDFRAAIKLDGAFVQAHNNLGLAHVALGEHKKAVVDFSNALVHKPNYVDALNNRGYAFMHDGSPEKALADFEKALEIEPENAAVFNNRGLLHMRAERFEEAVADFSRAIEFDPMNARYYKHRRDALSEAGRDEEAAEDAETVAWLSELERLTNRIQHKPDDAARFRARAAHYLARKEVDRALADYRRALRVDPDDTRTYVERAAYYKSVRKLDDAIGDCTDAIETAIENGREPDRDAYSIRGDAYLAQGYHHLAIPDYVKARRFDAMVAKAYHLRYEALKAKGREKAAQAALERAIVFDPSLAPDGEASQQPTENDKPSPPRRIPDTVKDEAEPIGPKSEIGSRKSERANPSATP